MELVDTVPGLTRLAENGAYPHRAHDVSAPVRAMIVKAFLRHRCVCLEMA
jgi:hypothetical protein